MGGVGLDLPPGPGFALVQHEGGWLRFDSPDRVLAAFTPAEVRSALAEIDDVVVHGSLRAAGFIAYEAASAFGLVTRPPVPGLPLLWFGLYADAVACAAPAADERSATAVGPWEPQLGPAEHAEALAALQERIASGDTYQVNFTFPLRARFEADPWSFFRSLRLVQQARYAAYLDTGRFALASASPELFFRWEGERLLTRPMKGTAERGRTGAEDTERGQALAASAKDRAENLMIVDMLRNDLGRIARPGTVEVCDLFSIERYPTLLQMTSTVTASTGAGFAEILAALFPCASVTGAPKIATMKIIAEAEAGPRGVYTGAIGHVGPGPRACFNVAIRTVVVDRDRGEAVYGIGSGVVADSIAVAEYRECRLKARILDEPPFRLLETLRFAPDEGFFLEEAHLARLLASAAYFGAVVSRSAVVDALHAFGQRLAGPSRVRLLVDLDGGVDLGAEPLSARYARPMRVALAKEPVDESSPWLFHKTTRREAYDAALRGRPGAEDVILWNRRGEVSEATRFNVVVDRGDGLVTPPLACGLLAGTFRAHLLETGEVREAVVSVSELRRAERLLLVNSVRGWCEARLLPEKIA